MAMQAFFPELGEIIPSRPVIDICAANSSHQAPAGTWMADDSELCASMFKNFAGPGNDRAVLANFLRWARAPLPGRQNGVNFENKRFAIYPEEGAPVRLVCDRWAMGPSNNFYAAVPVEIHHMIPDTAVSRTRLLLWTTFARQDESPEMILSYMAHVSAYVRLQEIMIVFVCTGGGGRPYYSAT